MKSVTIAGPIERFYAILDKYICDKQLHLEDAMTVLSKKEKLYRFDDASNYDPIIKRIEDIYSRSGMTLKAMQQTGEMEMSREEMESRISEIEALVSEDNKRLTELENEREHCGDILKTNNYFLNLEIDMSKLMNFKFMGYAFGHMPKSSYRTLNTYLSDLDVIFVKTDEDAQYVWGFYFTPSKGSDKIDEIFSSLYFEAIDIPAECGGFPSEVKEKYTQKAAELDGAISEMRARVANGLAIDADELAEIYSLAKKRKMLSDIRKKAVHSRDFFYLVGWMPDSDVKKLNRQLENKKEPIMFVATDPDKGFEIKPPTMLKNNPVFKPFEMFVKMYGLPDYTEIDPTPVLALTYIIFFGIMFGDVGQSAVFAIAGLLIYKMKKISLAGILGMVGLSGVFFGFIYGSIFGNEEILTPIVSPMHSINEMLIVTIGVGVAIIIIGLILNIINSFRGGRPGEAIFGHNGMAGLLFYVSLIAFALSKVTGLFSLPGKAVAAVVIISVLCMYLNEPLGKLIDGKKNWMPKDGMFYVENLFEMFEVILSFFTNTISFLRVGAFAIVHVGMMMVVSVLAKGGGVGGIIVTVLGNILVMGLEGLIVGIQVLRLEYYEMFSRYFSGQGREFISVNKNVG